MQNASRILMVTSVFTFQLFAVARAHANGSSENQDETKAIRAASKAYAAAVQSGDTETMSKMWTADADYIDSSGQKFMAHELVRQYAKPSSPAAGSVSLPVRDSSLRFVTPVVAIEDGSMDWGVSGDGRALTGRFTTLWVKHDGQWLLNGLRESVVPGPSPSDHLRPLSWLLGEWAATTDNAAILVSSHWSDDGRYIVREFLFRGDGDEDISATQRIGWDASAGRIRCWTFDSQGGSSEGVWQRDGDRWRVESREVLADGSKSRSTAVYTPGDDGQFTSELKSSWDEKDAKAPAGAPPALRIEFSRAAEDE